MKRPKLVPRPRRPVPASEDQCSQEDSEREAEAMQLQTLKQRKSAKNKRLKEALEGVRTFPDLLRLFRIRECDYVLIGDGSCTGNWNYQAGWACVAINVQNNERQEVYGGANMGTNILSEMMAYIYAFHWLSRKKESSTMYVDVFTDCEYVVQAAENSHRRKAYREVWHMVDAYKRSGMIIRWHWIPRDTLDLNQLSHNLANLARVAMKELGAQAISSMDVESINDLTPNRNEEVETQ